MLDEKDLKYLQDMETRILDQSAQITEKMVSESEARLTAGMQAMSEKILEQSAHNTRVILESYVEAKFNLLAENQQTIMEMMTPKSEIEELRGEIDLLKMVIRTMSSDIAELKQAQ